MTDKFAEQLEVIEDIIETNSDCHVVPGGDFNVDLSRQRVYTILC